jgi:hypothetical protein
MRLWLWKGPEKRVNSATETLHATDSSAGKPGSCQEKHGQKAWFRPMVSYVIDSCPWPLHAGIDGKVFQERRNSG